MDQNDTSCKKGKKEKGENYNRTHVEDDGENTIEKNIFLTTEN